MLKSAVIAMTVMGCDCDAKLCVPVEGPSARFASIEECEAAVPAELRGRGSAAYPLLKASCAAEPGADAAIMVAEAAGAEATAPAAAEQRSGPGGMSAYVSLIGAGAALAGEQGRTLLYRAGTGVVAIRHGLGEALASVSGVASSASGWVLTRVAP